MNVKPRSYYAKLCSCLNLLRYLSPASQLRSYILFYVMVVSITITIVGEYIMGKRIAPRKSVKGHFVFAATVSPKVGDME